MIGKQELTFGQMKDFELMSAIDQMGYSVAAKKGGVFFNCYPKFDDGSLDNESFPLKENYKNSGRVGLFSEIVADQQQKGPQIEIIKQNLNRENLRGIPSGHNNAAIKCHISINKIADIDKKIIQGLVALLRQEMHGNLKYYFKIIRSEYCDDERFRHNDQITIYFDKYCSSEVVYKLSYTIEQYLLSKEIYNTSPLGPHGGFRVGENSCVSFRTDTNQLLGEYGVYSFFDGELNKFLRVDHATKLKLVPLCAFEIVLFRSLYENRIKRDKLPDQDSAVIQAQLNEMIQDPKKYLRHYKDEFLSKAIHEFTKLFIFHYHHLTLKAIYAIFGIDPEKRVITMACDSGGLNDVVRIPFPSRFLDVTYDAAVSEIATIVAKKGAFIAEGNARNFIHHFETFTLEQAKYFECYWGLNLLSEKTDESAKITQQNMAKPLVKTTDASKKEAALCKLKQYIEAITSFQVSFEMSTVARDDSQARYHFVMKEITEKRKALNDMLDCYKKDKDILNTLSISELEEGSRIMVNVFDSKKERLNSDYWYNAYRYYPKYNMDEYMLKLDTLYANRLECFEGLEKEDIKTKTQVLMKSIDDLSNCFYKKLTQFNNDITRLEEEYSQKVTRLKKAISDASEKYLWQLEHQATKIDMKKLDLPTKHSLFHPGSQEFQIKPFHNKPKDQVDDAKEFLSDLAKLEYMKLKESSLNLLSKISSYTQEARHASKNLTTGVYPSNQKYWESLDNEGKRNVLIGAFGLAKSIDECKGLIFELQPKKIDNKQLELLTESLVKKLIDRKLSYEGQHLCDLVGYLVGFSYQQLGDLRNKGTDLITEMLDETYDKRNKFSDTTLEFYWDRYLTLEEKIALLQRSDKKLGLIAILGIDVAKDILLNKTEDSISYRWP